MSLRCTWLRIVWLLHLPPFPLGNTGTICRNGGTLTTRVMQQHAWQHSTRVVVPFYDWYIFCMVEYCWILMSCVSLSTSSTIGFSRWSDRTTEFDAMKHEWTELTDYWCWPVRNLVELWFLTCLDWILLDYRCYMCLVIASSMVCIEDIYIYVEFSWGLIRKHVYTSATSSARMLTYTHMAR